MRRQGTRKLLSEICIDEKTSAFKIYYRAFLFRFAYSLVQYVCRILCGLIASKCAIIISFCFHLMMLFIICFGWESAMTVASLSVNLILPNCTHSHIVITTNLCVCEFVRQTVLLPMNNQWETIVQLKAPTERSKLLWRRHPDTASFLPATNMSQRTEN